MRLPVFAIDVGYGSTKYTYRDGHGTVMTGIFPSLTPLAPIMMGGPELNQRPFHMHKTVVITVDRIEYEVGPDVPITAAYGWTGSALCDDYAVTANYRALLFGAFYFTGVTHVERLVLGLPVHLMKMYSPLLKQRLLGETHFGAGCVTIDEVIVVPQPLGTLVLTANNRHNDFRHDEAHLVVDVGYFTTSWISANGLTIDDSRSGGMRSGTWDICKRIADHISRAENEIVNDIERIDKVLREKETYLFYGKDIDLVPFLELTTPIAANAAWHLQSHLGSSPSVSSIILSGGGVPLYAKAIQQAFPDMHLKSVPSPSLANVSGYLIIGEAQDAREWGFPTQDIRGTSIFS
ncbi:plasmid segregation protein ParM [Paraburkholderia bannensis]|uniref:Plasmid segregation protein ParM n=1 Tax=Paraburkholderia bannensis TaxID=765414 RepID=A0A7W9WUM7_9BURK|nr:MULTISPECIES: PRTRC system protein D [Paraburkholderia]MBB3258964.1 plasmid segregation protein ParM [Paraburkholderia sp. WP4_3_2]MBB6103978.1 plasmid segregation protein ParM [Paraburkholderia bannensis]